MKSERIPTEVFFAMLDAAGVKSVQIARKLGVSRASVSGWRSGRKNMSDLHYQSFVDLAIGWETIASVLHKTDQGQGESTKSISMQTSHQSELGTQVHLTIRPNFQAKLHQSLTLVLLKIGEIMSGAHDWDYQALKVYAEEVHGLANALAIVMTTPEDKES